MNFFTSCQLVKLTVEDGARIRSIKATLYPIDTNGETYVDTAEEEVSSHLGYFLVDLVSKIDGQPWAAGTTVYQDVI